MKSLNNVLTTTLMEVRRIWNDKPSFVAYVLCGPVILAIIIGFVSHQSPEWIPLAVLVQSSPEASAAEDQSTSQIIEAIRGSTTFSVTDVSSVDEGEQELDEGTIRALVVFREGASGLEVVDISIDVGEPMIQQAVYIGLDKILDSCRRQISLELVRTNGVAWENASHIVSPFDVRFETNERTHLSFFDLYASGYVVVVVLGFSILYAATAITSERSRGTFERLFATPYAKGEIVTGKLIAQGIFAVVAAILCIITLRMVHHIALGNVFLVLITAALVGVNGVIVGLLISAFTYREAQSMLIAIVTFIGFIFLMTFLWPFESMHPVAKVISQGIPFTYSIDAIRRVNLLGAGFYDIWQDLAVMAGSIIVLTALTIVILRREVR